jgi:molybdopterin-guanine dinucleotide biosynthesis protein A
MSTHDVSAVILTGGRSTRMGGGDKTQSLIGSASSLDLLVGTLPPKLAIVIVGPQAPTSREAIVCRENPEFSGPVAALAAGLAHVDTAFTFVVAGDMPHAGALLDRLHETRAKVHADAVVPIDAAGGRRHLCYLARTSALSEAIESLPTPVDAAMRSVLALLDVYELQLSEAEQADLADFDTPEELEALRLRKR